MNHASSSQQACIRCGVHLPRTETENTLISSQFGWRLSRHQNDDGVVTLEWRCAGCWQKEKQAAAASRAVTLSVTPASWPGEAPEHAPASLAPASHVRPLASVRPRPAGRASPLPGVATGKKGP